MKFLNDKLALQIINKYKTGTILKSPKSLKSSERVIITKDTVQMARAPALQLKHAKAKSTIRKSEKLLQMCASPKKNANEQDLDTPEEEDQPTDTFKYRDVDKYIRSYKKVKDFRKKDRGEVIKMLKDSFKEFDQKRKQYRLEKVKSLPLLRVAKEESKDEDTTAVLFTFSKRGSVSKLGKDFSVGSSKNVMNVDTIPEIEFLPELRIATRRRASGNSTLHERDTVGENFTNVIINNTMPTSEPNTLIHSSVTQNFLEKVKLTRKAKHESKF